jgi:hypothetical protein
MTNLDECSISELYAMLQYAKDQLDLLDQMDSGDTREDIPEEESEGMQAEWSKWTMIYNSIDVFLQNRVQLLFDELFRGMDRVQLTGVDEE